MKRWEYSGGWKFLAVVLNQVCAVILVLSVIVCTLYLGSGGFEIFDRGEKFENTAYYQNEVEEQIYRCIRAVSRESKFEKNGVYDPNQIVDIEEYVRNNRILETELQEDKLYYVLSDLISWSKEGYELGTVMKITYQDGSVGYVSKNNTQRTSETVFDEAGEVVSSSSTTYGAEESYEVYETEETHAYSRSQASIEDVEQLESVEELFMPVGYSSIIEYAEIHQLSTQELQNIYRNLEQTLAEIYNDFYAYTENLEYFSPDMTNMRYMIIPKTLTDISKDDFEQKTYTNIKGFPDWKLSDMESLLEYFRTRGDFLIYDSSDMSFTAVNMPLSLSDVSSYLKAYMPSVDGDYILAIAIDPGYLANDNLQEYRQQYNEVKPLSEAAVYGVILGAVLYILTLVYLTLAAGRSTDSADHEVHLSGFDRIKSEAAAIILCIPVSLVCVGAYITRPTGRGLLYVSAWSGILTFALNAVFLCGYLSCVRRLRSHTLWKNSIVYSVFATLANMFHNRKATTKIVITYLFFLIVNLVLLCCGLFGFLLALLFDFIVGILLIQQALQRQQVLDGIEIISEGNLTHQISTEKLSGDNLLFASAVNGIGEGLSMAVEQSVRDERLKTDLITNVSHDIKTPLTSIINYVDLLKREDIQNDRAKNYIAILEDKASRLKHLTEDLVEASKISSGNIKLEWVRINFQELINQTNGEFSEKFEARGLKLVLNMPSEPVIIEADGRRLWRIVENLYNNVAKYAMPNSRVYVELVVVGSMVRFSVKNISEQSLNIDAEELTERFIRGDVARSTEGSGLGLSIARSLTELQKGTFDIYLDGDLFKVTIIFPEAPKLEDKEDVLQERLLEEIEQDHN